MPHNITGACLWCDGPTIPLDEKEDTMDCKIPGCTNEALAARGRYGGLCEQHKMEKAGSNGGSTSHESGYAALVKELTKLGKAVDTTRRKAEAAQVTAQRRETEADQAERAFRDKAQELSGV
jgi:hypothetical protein